MKSSFKNFLSSAKVLFVPTFSILVAVILLYIPRSNDYWNFLRQAPFYIGIYFWQSQRPDAFNVISAFILGLFADVLGGVPLGINIMTFLVLYLLSAQCSQRFNVKRFSYSWLLFSGIILITILLKATLISIFYRQFVPLTSLTMEWLLTVALFPLMVRIFIWVEKQYIHLEERYEKV